eukprot:jgi/Tetstr1/439134/TSEL_027586.t1
MGNAGSRQETECGVEAGPLPIDAESGRHAAAGFELLYALLRSEQANTRAQLTYVRRTAQSAACTSVRDIFPHGMGTPPAGRARCQVEAVQGDGPCATACHGALVNPDGKHI